MEALRCICDFLTISTTQLVKILNAVEGKEWRWRAFLACVGRCHDYTNVDFIKHNFKHKEVIMAMYEKFGILNMFSPYRPDGNYLLDLTKYEEKTVAKILCELCKAEGWAYMTEIKLQGKEVEKLTPEMVRNLGDSGSFECKYKCPEDKVKIDVREKLG